MGALKSGLSRLGDSTDVKSLMCDVKKNGMIVTDPKTGRVFKIREVGGEERPQPEGGGRGKVESTRSAEDILGDLFSKTQEIYNHKDVQKAADFVLDLAMQSVPAEAGSVLITDINYNDMYFAAASGPKASEIMQFRVPMGQSIAGFSAMEGVALAVSDADQDERFYADISDKLGYGVKSLVCSPCQKDGRTYAILELVNRNAGSSFSADDVNVLNFLANQFAQYLIQTGQTGE
jgi:putative methionine-R-sulfoxide reductase with GAF domain